MRSPWFFVEICKQLWIFVRNAFIKFPFFRLSSVHFFHFYLYSYFFISNFFHYFFRILFGCKLIFSLVTLFFGHKTQDPRKIPRLSQKYNVHFNLPVRVVYGSCLYPISLQDNMFFVHIQQEQAKAQKNLLVAQKLWEHASGSL